MAGKKKEEEEQKTDDVDAVVAKMQEGDPDMLMKLMAQVEELTRQNAEAKRRNAELEAQVLPAEGGRRLVRGENPSDFELPEIALPISDVAVFRSPFNGYRQVIRSGRYEVDATGERMYVPPMFAQFHDGVCVLDDDEEIALLRKKLEKKQKKGINDFIEVTDPEIKRAALQGNVRIASLTVTTDTPLEDVIQ